MLIPTTAPANRGDVGHAVAMSPFVGPMKLRVAGSALGYYSDGTVFRFDMRMLKRLGYIEATILAADGEVGSGKTSLVTKLALDERSRDQGLGNEFRLYMDIVRTNKGMLEGLSLIHELGAEPIDLSKQTINIYDQQMGLEPYEFLAQLVDTYEYVNGLPMPTNKAMVLMAATREFSLRCANNAEYRNNAHDKMFFKVLAETRVEHIAQAITNGWLLQPDMSAQMQPQSLHDMSHNVISPSDIRLDPGEVDDHVRDILYSLARLSGADYGTSFSGPGSLSAMWTQPVVAVNYTNFTDQAAGYAQQLFWRYKASANRRQDKRFLFSMEIHDENHNLFRILPYARNMANFLKVIRGTDTIVCLVSHRHLDYQALPPETREIAVNAMREPQVRFHGAQQDEEVAKAIAAHYGYPTSVRDMILNQEQGSFVVKIGKSLPTQVDVVLIDEIQKITFSEQASRSHLGEIDPALLALMD